MVPIFGRLFIWRNSNLILILNKLIMLVRFMILHTFLHLRVWLILIHIWCLILWVWPTNITLVKVLNITSVLYFEGYILFNPCLMCEWLSVIYKYFACACMLYAYVWSETVNCCIYFFLLDRTFFVLVYSRYDYT